MKNQLISKGLYIEGLRKIKIPSIIFAAVIFISQFVAPFMIALTNYHVTNKEVVGPSEILGTMMIIPALMVPILTLVAFFAFNKRSSSDFYQSLPYTRTCLFASWCLAVLTVTAALIIGGGILGYGVKLLFSIYYIVTVKGLADMLLSFLAATLFAMGCVLIAMSLTGTFITNLSCSLLMLFLPRLILFLARMLILEATPVLSDGHFLNWMNITHNTYITGIGYGFLSIIQGSTAGWIGNVSADIFTLVVSIIYIVFAAFLFNRRKSETAGHGSVNRLVQHIIRIALTLTLTVLGTFIIDETGEVIFGIIVYCLAIILFFAYEIIVTRKWINLVKVLPTLLIVAALTAALWLGSFATSRSIKSKHFNADQIESVYLPGFISGGQKYFEAICEKTNITDREIINILVDAYNRDLDRLNENKYYDRSDYRARQLSWSTEAVVFNTTTGAKYREVVITSEDISRIATSLSNNREYMRAFTELPTPIFESFTCGFRDTFYAKTVWDEESFPVHVDEYKELFNVLSNELKNVDPVLWVEHLMTDNYNMDVINLRYNADDAAHNEVVIGISQEITPLTYAKALNIMRDHQNVGNFMEFFGNDDLEDIEERYAGLEAFIFYTDENGEIAQLTKNAALGYADEDEGYHNLKELAIKGIESNMIMQCGNWIRVEYYYGYATTEEFSKDTYGVDNFIDRTGTLVIPLVEDWQNILDGIALAK